MIAEILNLFFYLDQTIFTLVETYGSLVYALLFSVIFVETGLVVAPFLPGDTLLFSAGVLANLGKLNFPILLVILSLAAILGDNLNYYVGEKFGNFLLRKKWVKQKYYNYSKNYYEKHGSLIIILCRFIPIVRTFAPFIAGISKMNRKKFFYFNVTGAVLWISSFLTLGYFLGNTPFVRNNFSLLVVIILVLSLTVPLTIEFMLKKSKFSRRKKEKRKRNLVEAKDL